MRHFVAAFIYSTAFNQCQDSSPLYWQLLINLWPYFLSFEQQDLLHKVNSQRCKKCISRLGNSKQITTIHKGSDAAMEIIQLQDIHVCIARVYSELWEKSCGGWGTRICRATHLDNFSGLKPHHSILLIVFLVL